MQKFETCGIIIYKKNQEDELWPTTPAYDKSLRGRSLQKL